MSTPTVTRAGQETTAEEISPPTSRTARRDQQHTKKKKRRLPPPSPTGATDDDGSRIEFLPWEAKGATRRRSERKARKGYYAPSHEGAPSSTRQAEVLNTSVLAAPTGDEGIVIGQDVLTRSVVSFDPFTAYEQGVITSPAVLCVGDVGSGKSSALKTVYVARPLILRKRRCAIFDKKDQDGRGEYCEVAEAFGATSLTFSLDGDGVILNPLDEQISAVAGNSGQFRLLRTLAELGAGEPLDKWEAEALRAARRGALRRAEDRGRAPVLDDVHAMLGNLDDGAYADLEGRARDHLHEAGIGVRFALGGLLDEYGGLFDGETTRGVRLDDRLTNFDISQLPANDVSSSMVVAVAMMWLLGQMRTERGMRTNLVAEEGWDLIDGPTGALMRSNTKLARGLGLSMITAIHKIADIRPGSPGAALLQEAQTVHLFRQLRASDQERCRIEFNLTADAAATVGNLPTGEHLMKIANQPEIRVRHVRSDIEVHLTDTDGAMRGTTGQEGR